MLKPKTLKQKENVNVFAARTECTADILRFLQEAQYHILGFEMVDHEDHDWHEDVFIFCTEKSLVEMLKIAYETDDCHYIFDTMEHIEEFTGERIMNNDKYEWYEEQLKSCDTPIKSETESKTEEEMMLDKIFELERDVHWMMLKFNEEYVETNNSNKYMSSYLARRISFAAIATIHETNAYEQLGILDYVKDDIKKDHEECICDECLSQE
jgi:hypothetical protein